MYQQTCEMLEFTAYHTESLKNQMDFRLPPE